MPSLSLTACWIIRHQRIQISFVSRFGGRHVSRPEQKRGLTHVLRCQIIEACPDTLGGLRDAALISVGYDTLGRSSEVAAMQIEEVEVNSDGTGIIVIPRSKADIAGEGRIAYLSPVSVRLLCEWMKEAELVAGPLFRSLHLHRVGEGRLSTSSIRRLIKRATKRAGLDHTVAAELSGHSMRIGAAQDMMVAGFDSLAIMQAGGWKSANVALRYVENASTRKLHESRWRRISDLSGQEV